MELGAGEGLPPRLACLLAGYLLGSVLTAEIVARAKAGKSASDIGSGNPGMANIMGGLGKSAGFLVLFGDVSKTALACLLGRLLRGGRLGELAVLYAGFGALLGHNFPLWRKGRGGKGVAVTCAWMILYLGLPGALCCAAGGAAVLLTGWLPLGAVVIPALALPAGCLTRGAEAGAVLFLSLLIMLWKHRRGLGRILRGQEGRTLKLFGKPRGGRGGSPPAAAK